MNSFLPKYLVIVALVSIALGASAQQAPQSQPAEPVPAPAAASTPPAQMETPAATSLEDEKDKKKDKKKKKEKTPKQRPMRIEHGILTVDGWTGKVALNYDIQDFKFLYISTPGIGTVIVSNVTFPGASNPQPDAFNDSTLTITVDGHSYQLATENRLLGKKPEPAFVLLDKNYVYPSNFPVLGYGLIAKAPYAWPPSKVQSKEKGVGKAPPLPSDFKPRVTAPVPTASPAPAAATSAPVPSN